LDGLHPCLCCLHDECVVVRFDKKGRPYSKCRICNSTTFMVSELALRGLWFFAPAVMKVLREWKDYDTNRLDQQTKEFISANEKAFSG